jgi:hypothetical protein
MAAVGKAFVRNSDHGFRDCRTSEEDLALDDDDDRIGQILLFIGAGAAIALIVFSGPISLYCLGAGLVYLLLGWLRRFSIFTDRSASFVWRFSAGLLTDTRKAFFWLFVGLGVVWAFGLWLSLAGSGVDPASVGSLELRVSDFGDRLHETFSAGHMLICLALAGLLSAATSTLWPLIALAHARILLSAAAPLLAALSAFTFVAADTATQRYQGLVGPIRAAIVADLERAAEVRRERAALQWLAADLRGEAERDPQALGEWREYFAGGVEACEKSLAQFRSAMVAVTPAVGGEAPIPCDSQRMVVQLARLRIPAASYGPPSRLDPWLSDFADVIEAPAEAEWQKFRLAGGEAPPRLALSGSVHRLRDLAALRSRASGTASRAIVARDAARGIVAEAVGSLIGHGYEGMAGEVVDVWRSAFVEAIARESQPALSRRARALRRQVAGLFLASASPELPPAESPLESPGGASRRLGSMEEVARADNRAAIAMTMHQEPPVPLIVEPELAPERGYTKPPPVEPHRFPRPTHTPLRPRFPVR